MKEKMEFLWESIWNNIEENDEIWEETVRAKIVGGWLIKHEIRFGLHDQEDEWKNVKNSLVFVPDAAHEWQLKEGK